MRIIVIRKILYKKANTRIRRNFIIFEIKKLVFFIFFKKKKEKTLTNVNSILNHESIEFKPKAI